MYSKKSRKHSKPTLNRAKESRPTSLKRPTAHVQEKKEKGKGKHKQTTLQRIRRCNNRFKNMEENVKIHKSTLYGFMTVSHKLLS